MVPLFRGLGYSIVVICCVSELYYAVICGWSFLYLFAGMRKQLPWTDCADGEDWHTPNCFTRDLGISCRDKFSTTNYTAYTWYNGNCTDMEVYCSSHGYFNGIDNGTFHNETMDVVKYSCNSTDGVYTGMQIYIFNKSNFYKNINFARSNCY